MVTSSYCTGVSGIRRSWQRLHGAGGGGGAADRCLLPLVITMVVVVMRAGHDHHDIADLRVHLRGHTMTRLSSSSIISTMRPEAFTPMGMAFLRDISMGMMVRMRNVRALDIERDEIMPRGRCPP